MLLTSVNWITGASPLSPHLLATRQTVTSSTICPPVPGRLKPLLAAYGVRDVCFMLRPGTKDLCNHQMLADFRAALRDVSCAVQLEQERRQEQWNNSVAAAARAKRNYNMAARHADGSLNMR
ncbi:hypothetical protein ABVT39_018794 [Epinephelus coioides]